QLVGDITIRTQTGVLLKHEWEPRNGGTVHFVPAQIRFTYFQLRPDLANPREVLDLRVRKAIAHTVDKQLLADALHEGQGIAADARQTALPRPFDNETRASFFTMMNWSTTSQPDTWLLTYLSTRIPGPENRWVGSNFGGWGDPEYDLLAKNFTTTLDRGQRD